MGGLERAGVGTAQAGQGRWVRLARTLGQEPGGRQERGRADAERDAAQEIATGDGRHASSLAQDLVQGEAPCSGVTVPDRCRPCDWTRQAEGGTIAAHYDA